MTGIFLFSSILFKKIEFARLVFCTRVKTNKTNELSAILFYWLSLVWSIPFAELLLVVSGGWVANLNKRWLVGINGKRRHWSVSKLKSKLDDSLKTLLWAQIRSNNAKLKLCPSKKEFLVLNKLPKVGEYTTLSKCRRHY